MLHGTSGLSKEMITRSIELGICKFNVNTEIREAYIQSTKSYFAETAKYKLTDLLTTVVRSMQAIIQSKIELFGSIGKAPSFYNKTLKRKY